MGENAYVGITGNRSPVIIIVSPSEESSLIVRTGL